MKGIQIYATSTGNEYAYWGVCYISKRVKTSYGMKEDELDAK